jgi:antitoxin ParD1/3/4
MANSLNLSLTDELRAFIDQNSGDGTLYATPSEFVRDILRRQKAQQEATAVRDAILDGYQDALAGRTHKFEGDLKTLLKKAPKKTGK